VSLVVKDMKAKHIPFLFVAALMLGLLYGYLSAYFNVDAYFGVRNGGLVTDVSSEVAKPSPVWLPSWLLCRLRRGGLFAYPTKHGDSLRHSQMQRNDFYLISTMLGGAIAALLFVIRCVVYEKTQRRETERGVEQEEGLP